MWSNLKHNLIRGMAIAALLICSAAAYSDEAPSSDVVVVELFTAQNCAFCPPANAYLTKLAQRDDVIALSYMVDYWDNPEYAHLPNHSERQRAYGWLIGKDRVYTPEMVIGGSRHATGYRKFSVSGKIRAARKEQSGKQVAIDIAQTPELLEFLLPVSTRYKTPHDVVLIPFKSEMMVSTRPGPDDDRTYTNVAFKPRVMGSWVGEQRKISIGLTDDTRQSISGFTLLLQEKDKGAIHGAKMVKIDGRS